MHHPTAHHQHDTAQKLTCPCVKLCLLLIASAAILAPFWAQIFVLRALSRGALPSAVSMTEQTAAAGVQIADTCAAGVTELLPPLQQMQHMMVHRTVSHFSHDMHAWQDALWISCSSKMLGLNICYQDLRPCVAVFCGIKHPVSLHLFYLQQGYLLARQIQETTPLRFLAEQSDTRTLLECAIHQDLTMPSSCQQKLLTLLYTV